MVELREEAERAGHWSRLEQLAATLAETVDYWARGFATLRNADPKSLPEPLRIERPGLDDPELDIPAGGKAGNRIVTDLDEIKQWFAKSTDKRG